MKATRYYSGKQESAVAKTLKGKRVANSGASNFVGGDVQTDLFLIECKTATTQKKSMSIQKNWLDKLKQEAIGMKKRFIALAFNFGGDTENYYIITEKEFLRFNELLKEEEDEN